MPDYKLNQTYLKNILSYNPNTGDFTWLINKNSYGGKVKIGKKAGTLLTTGKNKGWNQKSYWYIGINRQRYLAHRLAWFYMKGAWPKEIDHIDHNGLNNKWFNLREVTHKENSKNTTLNRNNKSGYTGVTWYKAYNKWTAQIMVNGKCKGLGYFIDINDAITARKNGEIKYKFHKNHGK